MNAGLLSLAVAVRDRLQQYNVKLITVESCTAGRIAATLASVPGISQWLCGGFVVYRSESKHAWLGISNEVLNDPAHGPVSQLTSDLLCLAALEKTLEADVSLAITGDIGPGAPTKTDGKCFVAIANRTGSETSRRQITLQSPAPVNSEDIAARVARLDEATNQAMQFLLATLMNRS